MSFELAMLQRFPESLLLIVLSRKVGTIEKRCPIATLPQVFPFASLCLNGSRTARRRRPLWIFLGVGSVCESLPALSGVHVPSGERRTHLCREHKHCHYSAGGGGRLAESVGAHPSNAIAV